MAQSDEEEDYMSMVFEDAPKAPKHETSLQRAARRRREGEAAARVKSKAELKAEAEAAREESLATALPSSNKGFKMMAKFGFKQGDTLGKSEDARKEPIQINIKEDKGGIGLESEKKRKFMETMAKADKEAKRIKATEGDYLELRRQEQLEKKAERQLYNAQKTAELLAEEAAEENSQGVSQQVPLKDVNVLWRGLARRRLEKNDHQKQERELHNSLASRLPVYHDDEEDNDSKIALGRDADPFYRSLMNDDVEEDSELAIFEALPAADRLRQIALFLREKYHYCFWCGHRYPDATMDGCPGVTEEEHD
ncbi:G-patch-domain-containing protein [Melanomma pulvis-pyrius CBS 109.77]|uniref:G-patch-domain-containing protein n=1 Tax=Melanomma pulvis-pyrius CBS 109.77 TaxID=1314802 RepID=A0A6A6X047_9PLEO|nr:G-patch-domain-containing protein [Melanomma pulvis-pyrius CBS 109.77]